MELKHRNSQKRIYFEDAICFVTTNTKNWVPYFEERMFCELFVEQLRLCKQLKEFKLYAWFLGYDHFHMLLQPGDEFDYSDVMQTLKRNFSRNVNFIIGFNQNDELLPNIKTNPVPEGDDYNRRLRRLWEFNYKKLIFRFRFKLKYSNGHPFPKFRWLKSFRDHIERDDKDFRIKWNYIKWNLIKHNMPNNWPYVFSNPKYADLINEIEL